MLARTFTVFVAFFLVIAVVGCEGDTGPAGPAGQTGQDGPPGPAVILAFGAIDGDVNPAVVQLSWPPAVTVTVARITPGIWDVTLVGNFPSALGAVMLTISDTAANYTSTGYIVSWSSSQIVFQVAVTDNTVSFVDSQFSYVVLGG